MSWPDVVFETMYDTPSRNGVYKPKEFHGRGCRIVNMGELFGFDFISNQEMNRVDLTEAELEVNSLEDGDLLFGRRSLVEAGAGKCSLVVDPQEPLTFESSIIRVRVKKAVANPRFLYYYFRSPQGRGRIRSIVSGTNVKGIRGSDLKRLPIASPPKAIQDEIAATLVVYDDLFENNRRRIQLLEESARQIYKEWFHRLRFPEHEHVKVENGVPEGWERLKFEDVCDTVGGGTPSTAVRDYWDGDITWVTPSDVTSSTSLYLVDSAKKITESGLRNSSAKLLPADAILMTSRASIGFFVIANRPVCTNQGFISVIPTRAYSREFLLFHLMSRVEEFRSRASGSTFRELSRGKFRELAIVWPSSLLLQQFSDAVSTLVEQIQKLTIMNTKLSQARDLLLPRLISGDITV